MVRAIKSSKSSSDVQTASTATPVITTSSTPVPESSSSVPVEKKSKRNTKSKQDTSAPAQVSIQSTPVVTPAVEEELNVVVEFDSDNVNDVPVNEQSLEFLAKLHQLGGLISSLKTEYRILEKKWSRELKTAHKLNSRRKRKTGNRAPSGFVKPTRISDELASFLGKDVGSEMARTSVTREINNYIRLNNLQDKSNGRKINPDAKLQSLLKLDQADELTYFNLQRYMSPHFAKSVKAEVAPASA